jgi:hypothetical protein
MTLKIIRNLVKICSTCLNDSLKPLSDDQLDDLIKQKEEELSTIGDENSREYLKQTRDTLLPKLMSGQLRIDEFKEGAA